jgi:S-methylmethionine-dependent homocysteine/selenocysteine methylase
VVGVLFNCCEPESISKAINEIRRNPTIQRYLQHPSKETPPDNNSNDDPQSKIFLGAYANRLTPIDPGWTLGSSEGAQAMRDNLSPDQYSSEFVQLWRSSHQIGGIQLIGGCCGMGPGHISALKELLEQ